MARQRLTEKWIANCRAPRNGRAEYVDAHCPGLWLRVSGVRDIRSFSVLYRVEGRLVRHGIGRHPRWTLRDAREEALRILREADAGLDPRRTNNIAAAPIEQQSSLSVPALPTRTYDDLVDAYALYLQRTEARSAKVIVANLRHVCMKQLRGRDAATIAKAELIAAIESLMTAGKSQAALNLRRRLMAMFSYAHDQDLITTNPTRGIRPPAKMSERDRVLTDAEISAIWNATFAMPDAVGAMYRVLFLTGQRRNEVAHMRWSEVIGTTWTIPRERVKSDRDHTIPLTATAMATLRSLPRHGDDAYVFTTTGGRSPTTGFSKSKAQLDAVSGAKEWRVHDIRRSVRTHLAALKVPREIARRVLNHATDTVDRVYDRHTYDDEKRGALELWEQQLLQLAGQPLAMTPIANDEIYTS